MEERAETVKLLQDAVYSMNYFIRTNNSSMIEKQGDLIKELTAAKKRFAGFHRAFFRANGLAEYISND